MLRDEERGKLGASGLVDQEHSKRKVSSLSLIKKARYKPGMTMNKSGKNEEKP